jgi:D-glycero-D-manno-heptose 1,7-bisphosphate phosphatase
VIYADNFSTIDIRKLLTFHYQHTDPASLLLFHAPEPRACGIVTLDDQQRIVRFEEKPAHPTSDLANAGVYVFDTEICQQVAAMQAFDLGFDVLPQLIGRMRGWVGEGYHRDIGTYEAYAAIQRFAVTQQPPQGPHPAVFLDRDGTLIEQAHYLSCPDQVKLLPGAGEAIQKLQRAGFLCVLVTNQSPIGQGIFTEQTLHAVHQALAEQLAVYQVKLDGIYYCPATSLTKDRTLIDDYDRKPGPGLLFKAAADLKLDLMRSWMVGDMISDILAGYHAHCQGTVWVETGKGLEGGTLPPEAHCHTAANVSLAADYIIQQTTLSLTGNHDP